MGSSNSVIENVVSRHYKWEQCQTWPEWHGVRCIVSEGKGILTWFARGMKLCQTWPEWHGVRYIVSEGKGILTRFARGMKLCQTWPEWHGVRYIVSVGREGVFLDDLQGVWNLFGVGYNSFFKPGWDIVWSDSFNQLRVKTSAENPLYIVSNLITEQFIEGVSFCDSQTPSKCRR